MSDINAAIGRAQLSRFNFLQKKKESFVNIMMNYLQKTKNKIFKKLQTRVTTYLFNKGAWY